MHRLLKRQLKKINIDSDKLSDDLKEFIKAVEESYLEYEDQNDILERSTRLSSQELFNSNRDLKTKLEQIQSLNHELRETQQKLLQSENMMQMQKMDSIGQLAGGVAHDFNNILGGIVGYADLLKSQVKDNVKCSKYVDLIEKSAQRGADLTKRLLSFARQDVYTGKPLFVSEIVEEVVGMLSRSIGQNITIVPKISDNPCLIGDHTQIYQVIMNLCINARDAMPDGGTLTLDAKIINKKDYPELFLGRPADAQEYVCLTVTDTGSGITPENLKKIYDPFFTTKGVGKGTGLGLAMVHGIVNSHKGFIDAQSKIGEGTSFSLYFPSEPLQKKADSDLSPNLNTSSQPKLAGKILVVDDEEMLREMCVDLLDTHNMSALTASNGEEAVTVFQANQKEICGIVMDVLMPVKNGVAAYREISKIKTNIPVIFVSGFNQVDNINDLIASPYVKFLKKPYSNQEILDLIAKMFYKKIEVEADSLFNYT